MNFSFQLADSTAGYAVCDLFGLLDETCQQTFVAKSIDEARDAFGVGENAPQGRARKKWRFVGA